MGDPQERDPALAGVEVGSNAHLAHLCARTSAVALSEGLFGAQLPRNFLVLEKARAALPAIIAELEAQERAWALEGT